MQQLYSLVLRIYVHCTYIYIDTDILYLIKAALNVDVLLV